MENPNASHPASKNGTLLLVDDDEDMLYVLHRLLRNETYQVLTAENGEQALDLLAANRIDVILTDQRMPGMLGTELLCRVKELYPETVRIVQSGYADLNTATAAINEGSVYKFLTKPWDEIQLKKHLSEAFRFKYLEDENRALKARIENTHAELIEKFDDYMKALSPVASTHSLYAEVIESIPIPMIALDSDKYLVIANRAAREIFKDDSPNAYSQHLLDHAMHGGDTHPFEIPEKSDHYYQIKWKSLNIEERCEGYILVLIPINPETKRQNHEDIHSH